MTLPVVDPTQVVERPRQVDPINGRSSTPLDQFLPEAQGLLQGSLGGAQVAVVGLADSLIQREQRFLLTFWIDSRQQQMGTRLVPGVGSESQKDQRVNDR